MQVRLMKDGQKVSLVVPEVMRPMKPKHAKSNVGWKRQREHPDVTLESHNDDMIGEDCFTFRYVASTSCGGVKRSLPLGAHTHALTRIHAHTHTDKAHQRFAQILRRASGCQSKCYQ